MWIRTIKGLKNPKKRIRVSLLILYDILVIGISEYTALLIRFEFHPGMIRKPFLESMIHYTPINIGCTLIIFALFSLYESLWRYASVTELLNLVLSCIVSAMFQLVGMYMMGYHLPRSYYILYLLVLLPLMMAGRFSYRLLRIFKQKVYTDHLEKPIITMVIGAGDAGTLIIKELQSSYHLSNKVVCVIDDNPQKKNTKLLGIPIVGGREEILEAVKRYKVQEIIIAIPTMPPKDRKALLEICKDSGCKLRILPGVYQLINEEVSIAKLREVEIEDLKGTEITGTNTMYENTPVGTQKAGETRRITFTQKMPLEAGEYMLCLGCTGYRDGDFTVFHRLYDVCNLTVITDKKAVGYFDLFSKVTLK